MVRYFQYLGGICVYQLIQQAFLNTEVPNSDTLDIRLLAGQT